MVNSAWTKVISALNERRALTPEQVRQLVAELPEPYKSMVLIAVLTGLRRGELFVLRWGTWISNGD